MCYHVLHVFKHGSTLLKERGFIICRGEDKSENRLPHEDIRAVIIAARGVTLSSNFVSSILSSNGIILHCDENYRPCGVTSPLSRVIDKKAYLNQIDRPSKLNSRIWAELLRGKTFNQQKALQKRNLSSPHLELALKRNHIDEGNCARRYWQLFFPSIGWISSSRDQKENNAPNQMLNYGYAVLSALCHRALIIHGLTPQLGVQHATRYRADPLVYDLMEPFRPIVDLMMAEFMIGKDVDFRSWCKKVGTELREQRLKHSRYSLKLIDAIDASASSLAKSYSAMSAQNFWVPQL